MRKHLLLLFAMCFVQLMAFAGPRSYQQALKIAQQQAERLGISMDAMSPPTENGSKDQRHRSCLLCD